jgi:hypothetical protein
MIGVPTLTYLIARVALRHRSSHTHIARPFRVRLSSLITDH